MGGGSSCDGKRASEERPGKTDPINMLEELHPGYMFYLPIFIRPDIHVIRLVLYVHNLVNLQRLSIVLKVPRQMLEGEAINYL